MEKSKVSFLGSGKVKLEGLPDFYVHFVEDFHLQDRMLWKKFVNVFKMKADIADNGWRGEYWGKMMRGACLCYQYTQNENLYRVLKETVEDLLSVQDELGRFSAYDVKNEFQGWDMWARKYVATGLFHFMDICKDEELNARILKALRGHFDYIISKIGSGKDQIEITKTSDAWGAINSCTILEPTIEMHRRTGDKRYFDFAEYILSTGGSANGDMIKVAVENKIAPCEYPVQKAYEVMSFFEGVLAYYELTKNEYYFKAVANFVEAVQKTEITVIGCAGMFGECFNYAVEKQTEEVEEPTQETCVTVTWMRLLTKLYALTGDVKYMASVESSALNALYGSINVYKQECYSKSKGEICGTFPFDSYSPLFEKQRNQGIGGLKQLDDGSYYGCCACIGAVAVALVPLTAVMKSEEGYVINEYFSGKIQCDENFYIRISGNYPSDGEVVITVEDADEKERTLLFREPEWCEKFILHTQEGIVTHQNGRYIVKKRWQKGEKIVINMQYSLRTEEKNGYTAFLYGPLTLARDSYKEGCKQALSEVDFELTLDRLQAEKKKPERYEIVRFEVGCDEKKILLSDYASCGKHWMENNQISVWLKYKSN